MTREAHPLERAVGMECYASETDGIGGRLRGSDEEFRVRELERFDAEPVDAAPGAYPHLVVRATLHGWDTNDFAKRLSDALRMSRERVSWAGTKDKHAVTTQLFSLFKVDPDEVPEINGADIEVLGRAGRSLEFGDLAGNAFEITVRDAERPERADSITDELRAFAGGAGGEGEDEVAGEENGTTVGVPNFFGQQRFGSHRPVTHEVGLRIVREEWEGAVMAYVGNPFETEPDGTRAARREVEDLAADRDWRGALDALPRRLGFERSMVHRLVDNGGTEPEHFREAIEELPWNLQRLFVNAAQSYAYNRILSERMRRDLPFAAAVEGDVCCFADADAPDGLALPDTDRIQRATGARVRTVNRHVERGRAFVTAPLVGTETELAGGEPGEIERGVLADLDLSPADFDLPGEFHSTGTRRAVLVSTDLATDGETFSFSLPKGSYATVLMREYLKVSPMAMG